MPRLLIIIASNRPGRVGLPVGQWFADLAREHGGFDVDVADLAEINLPFMDEPEHPMMRQYTHQHTKDWSAQVDAADAFVFVTPEYNFSFSAPLKNAIDFLYHEWAYKPVAFVSYGNSSGGLRAVQMLKQVVTTLSMMPSGYAVWIQQVGQRIAADGTFQPTEDQQANATDSLDELLRLADAMSALRTKTA
jgi:NAD(P)H-dependent FMN reductase